MLLLSLCLIVSSALASASSTTCIDGSNVECANDGDDECLDARAFRIRRVASFEEESVLTLLRGTVAGIIPREDIDSLAKSLPASEFVDAGGYDADNNRDGRAYNAPVAYAGLGLKELSTSSSNSNLNNERRRYDELLDIREKVRSAAEKSLGLCPGTLLIDYTTVSQKTVGGAHRPHADNCLHRFRDYDNGKKGATCDYSREHPYPNRVAASILYLNDPISDNGNFAGGEFYFANRSNGDVDEIVPVQAGKMIYFTSGVENLHGALPVMNPTNDDGSGSRNDNDDSGNVGPPRRLALAMWYVTDRDLEEYVPTFREKSVERAAATASDSSSNANRKLRPKRVHDPNDPEAPKELFVIPIPDNMDLSSSFQSMGEYLMSSCKGWKVSKYGEDTLHVLFKDHSAMFSLDFGVALDDDDEAEEFTGTGMEYADSGIIFERHTDGRKPASLQYMLQESVVMHGVLDALSTLIMEVLSNEDGGVEEGKKRQYFEGEVEKARSTLPTRRG